MKLVNHAPFAHLLFESRTPEDRAFYTLVMRGLFHIEEGALLRPVREQEPLPIRDRWLGEPGQSSLLEEGGLSPLKPRTDVVAHALAMAPGGHPRTEWPVRLRVGEVSKDLLVRGPAVLQHVALDGWRMTERLPTREVPIEYERAYGGRIETEEGVIEVEENPIGAGFLHRRTPRDQDLPAPQVFVPGAPELRPGQEAEVAGLLPLPLRHPSRLPKAGTFDEAWHKSRWPRHPEDFDYAYYNCASPGLIYPGFARGDERVELVHLGTPGALTFGLPGYKVMGLLRKHGGELRPFMVALDTIFIDVSSPEPSEHRVALTWRGTFWKSADIRVVELRLDGDRKPGPMIIPFAVD